MVWSIKNDLDENITLLRNHYETITKKNISKKDFILKLIYDNSEMKKILELNGKKIDKEILKMPSI